MRSFLRQGSQPRPFTRRELSAVVAPIAEGVIAEIDAEIAFLKATTDCFNPDGHDFVASCGSIACPHCGRIAWL
jgi:hypothetical protein